MRIGQRNREEGVQDPFVLKRRGLLRNLMLEDFFLSLQM